MPLLEHQLPVIAAMQKHFRSRETVKWGDRDIHPPVVCNASVSSGKSIMIAALALAVRQAANVRAKAAAKKLLLQVLIIQRQGELCSQNSEAAWSFNDDEKLLNNSLFSASCAKVKSTHFQVVYATEGTLSRALGFGVKAKEGEEPEPRKCQYRFSPYTEAELALSPEARARLGKFHPDLMGWDECFAAGTSIDGLPIELVQVGDMVRSFNHESGAQETRRVNRLYRSRPTTLCTVRLADGRSFLCTENHPFFTQDNGYVIAKNLKEGSPLASMHDLRKTMLDAIPSQLAAVSREGQIVLLKGVQQYLPVEVGEHSGRGNESKACVDQNEDEEPDASGADSKEGFGHAESNGSCAASKDGEWLPATEATSRNVRKIGAGGNEPGHGVCCAYGGASEKRDAESLQTGRLLAGNAVVPGDGRQKSWDARAESPGCQKGQILEVARVDGVEIHEPTGDGTFGGLLPDGHVYNFEVDGNHNYFVDGVLVHNCHQIPYENPDSMAVKIISHFYDVKPSMRFAGFSGSCFRGTESIVGDTPGHLWRKFAKITQDDPDYPEGGVGDGIITTEFMVEQGWVVPPVFGYPDDDDKKYDFSGLKPSGWDYDEAEMDAVVSDWEKLLAVCSDVIEKAASRKGVLIFAATQRHARQIAAAMKALGVDPDTIGVITDKTKDKDRRRILDEAKSGVIKYTINVAVLTTGVNVPWWDTLVFMRPIGSLVLLIQAIGRVLRLLILPGEVPMFERSNLFGLDADDRLALIAASSKPDALVMDYAGVMDTLGQLYENQILDQAELEKAKKEQKALIECPKCETMNSPHARRCIGKTEKDPLTGADVRCDHFWHFRLCPGCETQNDQVARECRSCKRMLIDPNAALNGKHYTAGESIPVRSMQVGTGAGGKLWIRYELSDGTSPIEIYWPHAGKQIAVNNKVWKEFVKRLPISERERFRLGAMKASTILENEHLIPVPLEISARQNGNKWVVGKRKYAEAEEMVL